MAMGIASLNAILRGYVLHPERTLSAIAGGSGAIRG